MAKQKQENSKKESQGQADQEPSAQATPLAPAEAGSIKGPNLKTTAEPEKEPVGIGQPIQWEGPQWEGPQWQYETEIITPGSAEQMKEVCNRMGQAGWELVNIMPAPTNPPGYRGVFKRQLPCLLES